MYLGGNVGRLSLSPPTIYSAPLGNRGRLSQTLDTGRHCLHVISVQASRNWTRSLSTSQACGNLSVIRVATVQSTSPPGKRAPASFSFAAAQGGARTDDLLCTTGHGDTDLTFRKTANVLFFCTTDPDLNANGSICALLQNGTTQGMEETREIEVHSNTEPRDLGRDRLMASRDPTDADQNMSEYWIINCWEA